MGGCITAPDGTTYSGTQGAPMWDVLPSVWSQGPISEFSRAYHSLSISSIPYAGASWTLTTYNEWGSPDTSNTVQPGYFNYKEWYPQPMPIQLQISTTRFGHDLRLRQAFSTSEYYLNQQGSAGTYYENGQESYYYINADAAYTPGFDYWIYDATTGEHSPVNQPNLGTWVDLRPPTLDSVSNVWYAGVSLGYHFNSDYASDVVVERRLADLSEPWTEVAWTQLGGAMYGASFQIENHGLHPGDVYLFRLRTRFGELRSEPSNELAFSPGGYLSNGFYSIQAGLMGQSVSAARLEWTTDGPTNEGAYVVQMRNGTSGAWTTLGTVAADAFDDYVQVGETGCHVYSFQPIGLVPGRNYFFRVRLVRPSDDHFENPSPVATLLAPVDSDGDGIPDAQELVVGTNPNAADSDGDGYSDGEGLAAGTNPNDAAGHPNYHGGGTSGGGNSGGEPPTEPSPPESQEQMPEIPVVNYAAIDLTKITGVKATGGMAFGDDGKIAFYETTTAGYRVAVWSPDGTFKTGTVPDQDAGARLYVVGINSQGMLAGNTLGYDQNKSRTIPVAFKAEPNWGGAGAAITYPFLNPHTDCFVVFKLGGCGVPETSQVVPLPSVVEGVSRMSGPWGRNTAWDKWGYQCGDCCPGQSSGYEESTPAIYFSWSQVFYGAGAVTPDVNANYDQLDANSDGKVDEQEIQALNLYYDPDPYLTKLIDVSFDGQSPYGEWSESGAFSPGTPSGTQLGTGFSATQSGAVSVERNKTNNAPQAVHGLDLVTSEILSVQEKIPSGLRDYIHITSIIDNANGETILANALVWSPPIATQAGGWKSEIVVIKASEVWIIKAPDCERIHASLLEPLAGVKGGAALGLLPIKLIELAPTTKDEAGLEIGNSQIPKALPHSNEMVEENPAVNRIAHREIKLRMSQILKGKKVRWTMDPKFKPEGTDEPIFRGGWSGAAGNHRNRFEGSSTYGGSGYTTISQAEGQTVISDDGHTAIRANVPPWGFNRARIKVEVEGAIEPVELLDLEVPGVIVIDPGHGIGQAGSSNEIGGSGVTTGALEHKFALDIGNRIVAELRRKREAEALRIKIFMTRTGEENITFPQRTSVARLNGCDVYASIHFNDVNGVPLRRHPFGMWDSTGNYNLQEDKALALRLRSAVQRAIGTVESVESRNSPTDGVAAETHEANLQKGLDTCSDSTNATTPNFNGNIPGHTPCRSALIELEWMSNHRADLLFNEGNLMLSATAVNMRNEAAKEMAKALIEDMKASPLDPAQ